MRILDCKSPVCSKIAQGAPKITDYLCDECKEHFASVQKYLDAAGVEYTVNPTIVRGLDYYTKLFLSSLPTLSVLKAQFAAAADTTDLLRSSAESTCRHSDLQWALKDF